MSGNINDTNVDLIKTQIFNLISDLESYSKSSRNINIYEEAMKKKYSYLLKTSKTLFCLIIDQYKYNKLDQEHFNFMINKMLDYIVKIQNNQISQYDASAEIGTDLAYKYIPQLNEKIKKELSNKENDEN